MTISSRLRFEVLKRDCFTCCYCGRRAPDVVLHVDHIVAVAEGGSDHPSNLQAACRDCNLGKSDKPLLDYTKFFATSNDDIEGRVVALTEIVMRRFPDADRKAARHWICMSVDELLPWSMTVHLIETAESFFHWGEVLLIGIGARRTRDAVLRSANWFFDQFEEEARASFGELVDRYAPKRMEPAEPVANAEVN